MPREAGGEGITGIPVDIYQVITGVDKSCAATGKYQISTFVKSVSNSCFINIYNGINTNSPLLSVQIQGSGSGPVWEEVLTVVPMGLQGGWTLAFEADCNTQDTVWSDDIVVTPVS